MELIVSNSKNVLNIQIMNLAQEVVLMVLVPFNLKIKVYVFRF